ncbi:MAG: hypothetical protein JW849_03925 [Phycisphaerae bacterium]|nr:hypothetical protein [Phycisphaerae bacterium]
MKTVAINTKRIVARLSEGNVSLCRGCYAMKEKQDGRYEKLRGVRFSEKKGK